MAGGVETDGVLTGNRFVDTGVAGVDGVSYAGRAEPFPALPRRNHRALLHMENGLMGKLPLGQSQGQLAFRLRELRGPG